MMGRTHGVHAEPITLGVKLATRAFELDRGKSRLRAAFADTACGKLSGPVGTYSHLEPELEAEVLGRLGLTVEPAATQVVSRDRHAALVAAIAVTGGSLERIATEIRNLQHTEIGELAEPFKEGQTGSSAMPHKRNPITAERVAGLSRLLRGYAVAALEDQALWHERDSSHSSVERVALPDATTLLDYMLVKTTQMVDGLRVDAARMRRNVDASLGLWASSRVLLALVDSGIERATAYRIVQRAALAATDSQRPFADLLATEPEVTERISADALSACFDESAYLRHAQTVIDRLVALEEPARVSS
jgi:adenylosuccinate lyase